MVILQNCWSSLGWSGSSRVGEEAGEYRSHSGKYYDDDHHRHHHYHHRYHPGRGAGMIVTIL